MIAGKVIPLGRDRSLVIDVESSGAEIEAVKVTCLGPCKLYPSLRLTPAEWMLVVGELTDLLFVEESTSAAEVGA